MAVTQYSQQMLAGGIGLLALLDCMSFVASAALVAAIPASPRTERTPAARTDLSARITRLRTDWRDGIRLCLRRRVLRTIAVFLLITSVGEGVMSTLFAPFVRSVLHASAGTYGLISAAQAIGGIGGGLLAASIGNRLRATRTMGRAAVAFGLIDLAVFLYPGGYAATWPAMVLMIVVGVPGALTVTSMTTLLQRQTADSQRGRVFGALSAVEGIAVVAGTSAAGFLGRTLGIVPILVAQGVGYVLAGTLVVMLLRHAPPPRPAPEIRAHRAAAR
ncbi:MFS transporter [Actinacidiphila paucisporea]|uniref:Major Facilitator Superfamily protein n=1 Tax=Actinacidiphila paucisporea TaxID=310782 RepID=A0A1M6Z0W1_9ACTN|nr:MFS transporter [Actinacidiphila paucisporea]SHL23992.1 Major Facilitator Superfamily protein [Actinacidiphila paucisporea]